jgi:hypothetical protein
MPVKSRESPWKYTSLAGGVVISILVRGRPVLIISTLNVAVLPLQVTVTSRLPMVPELKPLMFAMVMGTTTLVSSLYTALTTSPAISSAWPILYSTVVGGLVISIPTSATDVTVTGKLVVWPW